MMARRRATPLSVIAVIAVALLGAGPASAGPTDPTQAATTTALAITPTTSEAGQPVRLVAQVTPVADGGHVAFTARDAASGALRWTHREPVDANGRATIPDMTAQAGEYSVVATYQGGAYFAPSTSAPRRMTVLRRATTATLTLHSQTLVEGQSVGFTFGISPAEAAHGWIELLIGGDVYFGGRVTPTSPRMYEVPGTLPPGVYQAKTRFKSMDWKYAASESVSQTLRVGDTMFPRTGIRIDYDRFSTPDRDVEILVGASDDAEQQAATHVRFANDSSLSGGLLANGTTFVHADAPMPWTLASGADGPRTVWAQFKRPDGSWSAPLSDSIYLDTTAPRGSFVINDDDKRVGDTWSGTLHEQQLRGSVSDASLVQPGGNIVTIAVSNDQQRWFVRPFTGNPADHTLPWMVDLGDPASEDVTRTVYMKWRDAAGNWSAVASDTIELYFEGPPAYVLINGRRGFHGGGDPYHSTTTVTLTFPIIDMPAEGLASVRISGTSGGTARTVAWSDGLTVDWSLTNATYGYTAADGVKNIHVVLVSKTGRRAAFGDLVILDRVVPTSTSPQPALAANTVVDPVAATTAVVADIRWKGKDANKVTSYRLQRSLNAGTWAGVTLSSPSVPSARQVLRQGSTFRYRSRSVDAAGNVGRWKAGPTFRVAVRQEKAASITYRGRWQPQSRTDALGGGLRVTSAQGASAQTTFTGRAIAVVAPRGANGDTFDVYVDGRRVKTVHLALSSGYHPRRVVFSMAWSSRATHTIRIVKKYNNGYTLPLDAFVILN